MYQRFYQGNLKKGEMVIELYANARTSRPDAAPSREGLMKLNYDGSYVVQTGQAGRNMVLRDHTGSIGFMACRELRIFSKKSFAPATVL